MPSQAKRTCSPPTKNPARTLHEAIAHGDDEVSLEDLRQFMKEHDVGGMVSRIVAPGMIMDYADIDRDGTVRGIELETAIYSKAGAVLAAYAEKLRNGFETADDDHDGFVSMDELRAFIDGILDPKLASRDVVRDGLTAALMVGADQDGVGAPDASRRLDDCEWGAAAAMLVPKGEPTT